LFGQLTLPFPIPVWLNLFSLGLTIAGTLFLGIVYATLTEQVLSARFRLRQHRPPAPKADHIVLVGLNRVGRRIAGLLQRLGQPVLGLSDTDLAPEDLPKLPVVVGQLREGLKDAHLSTARSLVAVTDDDVTNLEVALEARIINPACRLVIRMDDPTFGGSVSELVPGARALGTYALAAEAFAAATFGESVHGLLQLDGTTVLVTEYAVTAGDTLAGRLLAEIAYGYGLVPILHQRAGRERGEFLPSDDLDVLAGDRLIVLATSEGLRRVELGRLQPPTWLVRVDGVLTQECIFDAVMTLARVSGCQVSIARAVMSRLPATFDVPLYRHQALRLVRELNKVGCRASAFPNAAAAQT
jgi:Trk K+ transport system NAD-binding subunit